VTPIGAPWPAMYSDVESLAYDAGHDRLYAVDRTTGQLLLLSRTGAAVALVGNRTLAGYAQVRALAFRPANGRLHAVDQASHSLLSIDPSSGIPTVLCTMATEAHGRVEELDFFNDKLYGVDAIDDGTNLVSAQLQRIYTNVGLVQNVGPVLSQVSANCLIVDSISEDHTWTKVSGPGIVTFSDVYSLTPTVRFSKPGTYVLQLSVFTTSGPRTDTVTIVQQDWTPFSPSADTRFVYVSSASGNDAFNGLSPSSPKRTIAAGRSLLRNGFPDWLLLERGGVWDEVLGSSWNLSGRSASERLLVSSYGSSPERPLIRTGFQTAFSAFAGTPNNHIAIVGLHFWCNAFDGSQGQPRGLQLFGQIQNFLIEDCCIEGFETNVVVQGQNEYPSPTGRHKNIALRRNVIIDAYNTGGSNSEGIFASGTDGLILSENVFDRNGWRDDVPGSVPTWYRHNIYIQNLNTDVVVVSNIVARTDGLHSRSGGIVDDNLILRNALGLVYGGGGFPAIETDGVSGTIRRNVLLDGGDLQPGSPRGWGLYLSNVRQATVDRNIVALNSHGHAPFPVSFDVANDGIGVESTVFSNNLVYAWSGITRFTGNATQTSVKLLNNCFQNPYTADPLVVHDQSSSTLGITSSNNVFGSIAASWAWMQSGGGLLSLAQWKSLVRDTTSSGQWAPFPDPGRSIPSYMVSLGRTGTLVAFVTEARKQSRANWRPEFTADAVNTYVRAGYGM